MNRLLRIGFAPAGHWHLDGERVRFELTRHATERNILYAFVCDGQVKYVGKTVQALAARMLAYRNPAPSQSTNVRNNARIREQLEAGAAVEIFALPDNGLHHYGPFHLNLAAGLEDSIISVLKPAWNGGKPEEPTKLPTTEPVQEVRHTFGLTLQPTYHRTGFFNVGVADQEWFAADGDAIEIFLGTARTPVLGTINRRVNTNGTPRIMGGTDVRDWFQSSSAPGAVLKVEVFSPASIRLRLPRRRV
jgi:hypothetical protein